MPAGFPSIYGERQEHTLVWEEGKESRTDKHHRMDFGKTNNPKRRVVPCLGFSGRACPWLLLRGHGALGAERGWMYQSLEGTWDTCGTYHNPLRAKEDPGPSVGNNGSQQEV